MDQKPDKVTCLLCGSKLPSGADWRIKLNHVIEHHPDEVSRRLLPFIFHPEYARQIGQRVAEAVIAELWK